MASRTAEVLQEMADHIDSFIGASVVGVDGMSIANLILERDFNEEKAAASLSQLVKQATDSSEAMDAGEFEETITTSEKYIFLTRPLGNGKFFIQVILRADGNLGAARMYVEDYEDDILETLPRSAR